MSKKADPLDALIAQYSVQHGPTCSVAKSPHRALIIALIEKGATAATIVRILQSKDVKVAASTIGRHMKRLCRCG